VDSRGSGAGASGAGAGATYGFIEKADEVSNLEELDFATLLLHGGGKWRGRKKGGGRGRRGDGDQVKPETSSFGSGV